MELEREPRGIYLEIEQAGSVETLPLQKMTLGSGEGDAVPIMGLPKAFASVTLDRSGEYRIRVNESGQVLFVEPNGEWATEVTLRDGVVFRMGMARVRCYQAGGKSAHAGSVVASRAAGPAASGGRVPGPTCRPRRERGDGLRACLRGRDLEARSFHLELEQTLEVNRQIAFVGSYCVVVMKKKGTLRCLSRRRLEMAIGENRTVGWGISSFTFRLRSFSD